MTDNDAPRRKGLLHYLGIQHIPGKGRKIRKRFYVFLLLFFFLVGMGALMGYWTSPSFCRSCHIMEPYYQAWEHSKHNVVACVDCHYPPGTKRDLLWHKFQAMSQVVKYVTRTYSSKPFAEVEDASCLRSGCHSTRLLRGRVISESGILFDHRPHLEEARYGRQLRCVSCHSQVVVGKHIEVTWDSCYICHLKGRKEGRTISSLGGCLGCHVLPDKDVKVGNLTYNHKSFLGEANVRCESCHQDVMLGDGDVPGDRCVMCHNQPEHLARYDEEAFIHDNHVTQHNIACFHCHTEIRHATAKAGTKEMKLDCAGCHPTTHEVNRSFYQGQGARGVEPMPSPMYVANVDCIACHLEEQQRNGHIHTYLGSEQGCTACHGEEYVGMLSSTHELVDGAMKAMQAKLTALKGGLPEGWEKKTDGPAVSVGLSDAEHNLELLEEAHAVHNIYFAAQILRHTDQRLSAIGDQLGIKTPDTSELPVITGAFCATICHDRIEAKVPPETVIHDGKEMPHLDHTDMDMACTYCHVFGQHKDVELVSPTPCDECHDE